jgi:cell division protein FtsL
MTWRALWLSLLFAAVLMSALGVVYSRHQSRALFTQLQLEQSTWTAHGRIETIATARLHMHSPSVGSIVAVEP